MDGNEIGKSISFWYLGFIIQENVELIEDFTNKIKPGRVK